MSQNNPQNQPNTPSSQRQSPAGQQQAEQSTGGNTHRQQGARNDADTHAQGRDQKVYALTAAGRKQMARELESWERSSAAIGLVVREA